MDGLILVLTALAGCLMPVQPAVNAVAAQLMGSPYLASFFSFLTGTLVLGLLCLALRLPWPDGKVLTGLPWWVWTAGSMGAFFVTMTIVAVPRLGAMSVMALLIAGQMGMSLVMDHFGWLGIPSQPISMGRVLGAILLFSGVVLIFLALGHLFIGLMWDGGVYKIDFNYVAQRWASPFWQTWDLVLLWLAQLHGGNGMRTIIADYARKDSTRFWLNSLLAVSMLLVLVVGTYVLLTFDPNIS